MITEISGFATIRISSHNVSQSRDWYKKFLQTEPVEDLPNCVSFKIQGVCLDISEADTKSPSSAGGSVGYWLVKDLDHVIARAVELGGEVYRGPLEVKETRRKIVQIKDPIGNVIGFEAVF